MDTKDHWERIYTEKTPDNLSWYQLKPEKSLELVHFSGVPKDGLIIDVGAGALGLVDYLIDEGYAHLKVLDISGQALSIAKGRLGEKANQIEWLEADVTKFEHDKKYDLWHDRAVFHFLVEKEDRDKYLKIVRESLKSNGFLILATFAEDGPERCSGLLVRRYDQELIKKELGSGFELIHGDSEIHVTPWKSTQRFNYFLFRKKESHG